MTQQQTLPWGITVLAFSQCTFAFCVVHPWSFFMAWVQTAP